MSSYTHDKLREGALELDALFLNVGGSGSLWMRRETQLSLGMTLNNCRSSNNSQTPKENAMKTDIRLETHFLCSFVECFLWCG
jgi:hypothetical protein